jgi:hypothetical protein
MAGFLGLLSKNVFHEHGAVPELKEGRSASA